jgi:UDP-glucose 4-epimerase
MISPDHPWVGPDMLQCRAMEKILVTGGAGYIGSHTCVELLEAGYDVVVVDDLSNGSVHAVEEVASITGRSIDFVEIDVADRPALEQVFVDHTIHGAIHFAGLKAVGESVAEPLRYHRVNVGTAIVLAETMAAAGVHRLVFSSSATVYSPDAPMPLHEDAATGPINPYGDTKEMIERILRAAGAADERWAIGLLRYFNPVGAHESGRIGEDPAGLPNNLMPFIMQVAVGKLDELAIFGDDYDTPDGTCIRDYIHVVDLARGHVAALRRLADVPGVHTWNLGTGHGTSVTEMVAAAERAVGHPIPHRIAARRPGDQPVSYADPTRAHDELGWRAERTVDNMCHDHWRWQQANPDGYRDR